MYIKNETNTKDTKGPSTRKKQRENRKISFGVGTHVSHVGGKIMICTKL